MELRNVDDIFSDAVANKGGTYWASIQRNRYHFGKSEIESGYYVARKDRERILAPHSFTPDTLLDYLLANFDLLCTDEDYFLGIWHNPSDRLWYLDISQLIEDVETATLIGQNREQLAIWDIANESEIVL